MSPHDLLAKLRERPPKPFRVVLSDNSVVHVLGAGSISVGVTSAILPLEYIEHSALKLVARWKTVPLDDIVGFVNDNAGGDESKGARQ